MVGYLWGGDKGGKGGKGGIRTKNMAAGACEAASRYVANTAPEWW